MLNQISVHFRGCRDLQTSTYEYIEISLTWINQHSQRHASTRKCKERESTLQPKFKVIPTQNFGIPCRQEVAHIAKHSVWLPYARSRTRVDVLIVNALAPCAAHHCFRAFAPPLIEFLYYIRVKTTDKCSFIYTQYII